MTLSSSCHPQHDRQTEIVNKRLEIMLRAYVAKDRHSWAEWLHLLEHAYNSTVHASTGYSPYQLLYGFTPKGPLDFANPNSKRMRLLRDHQMNLDFFLLDLETHRSMACDSIAAAQAKQAAAYNAGRRDLVFQPGDLVLVNPHTLEWLESKGAGAELCQRWIGPFPIAKRVADYTYRVKLPRAFPGNLVFNVEHLRVYHQSPSEFGHCPRLSNTRKYMQEGEELLVSEITGHRFDCC
jgi:hypothetical protein